ncbi:MAG: tRNA (N(6)-L-threonylcarbamoyladenosine(37)-C(2))-methylthiotransferase MtaB, partial [bacterium]
KSKIPDISLGCDVIVGFPSETDEQFENTYNNLCEMPFSYMHVFPYSVRPKTPAAIMLQVDEKTKKIRATRLRELAKVKKQNFLESLIGKNIEVLVEKNRDKSGYLKGVSSNYIQATLEGNKILKNQIVLAKVVSVDNGMVRASCDF